jgi:GNAT superfamily N-acetyltransferase
VRIAPVSSRSAHRAFWTLPYRLYRGMPGWPAPLRRDERRRWDPARNPALEGRDVWRFVAWRSGKPIGRIAAFYDPAFAERWAPATGGFGCFETVDDSSVAEALLAAAAAALRGRGARTMFGPVGLTFHDEMGLLIEGHEQPASLLTPVNHAYYGRLLEEQGCRPWFDQHAYGWSSEARLSPVALRAARTAAAAGITVRSMRPAAWSDELRLLHRLYNESFHDTWGFLPIGWEDFRRRAEDFRPFYRPELILVAEQRREAIGFALALPELSPLLARIRGDLWPLGLVRLTLGARSVRRSRMMMLGVRPAWRAAGVAAALVAEMVASGSRLGLTGGELSLVHEGNRAVRHVIAAAGGVRTKTFRIYRKTLEAGRHAPDPLRDLAPRGPPSDLDQLIHRGPEVADHRGEGQLIRPPLGHEHADQLFFGIDEPRRPERPIPSEPTRDLRDIAPGGDDPQAEAPTARAPEVREEGRKPLLLRREVIHGHQCDRWPRQNAFPSERCVRQHHLAEGEQIIRRGHQPAGAGFE